MRGDQDVPVAAWIAVLLAAVLVGVPSLWGEFVLDDRVAIVESACVTEAFRIDRIFGTNFWCELGTYKSIQSWRPWPVLVWWPLHRLGGGEAWPFHLLNVLLHAGCSLLVLGVGRDLGLRPRAAATGAAVFAVLAIHIDAVASAVGAAELWATLWILLAIRAHHRRRATVLVFAAMACMSKESAVIVVPVVLVLEFFGAGQGPAAGSRRRGIALLVGITVVAVGTMAIRAVVLGDWAGSHIPAHVNPLVAEPWLARIPSMFDVVGRYHGLTAIGYPLSADYAHAAIPVGDAIDVQRVAAGVVLALLWGALLFRYRREPVVRSLILWFLGACLVVSNLVLLPAIFAERLFYQPSVPLVLLIGLFLDRGLRRVSRGRGLIVAAVASFLCLQSMLALIHGAAWRSQRNIIATTVAHTPRNARARMWLAWDKMRSGKIQLAAEHATAANSIRPEWGAPIALLATVSDVQGRPQEALAGFRTAMDRDPHDPEVVDLFIQFLLRYGYKAQARHVYDQHTRARGQPSPKVTVP